MIEPVIVVMLLTFVVWLFLFSKRMPFILSMDASSRDLSPAELARRAPPSVRNPSDNLKNLFELPVLFYALSVLIYILDLTDGVFMVLAWVFAVFRILHSAMHCTANVIQVRFAVYQVSAIALWAMLLRFTALQLF